MVTETLTPFTVHVQRRCWSLLAFPATMGCGRQNPFSRLCRLRFPKLSPFPRKHMAGSRKHPVLPHAHGARFQSTRYFFILICRYIPLFVMGWRSHVLTRSLTLKGRVFPEKLSESTMHFKKYLMFHLRDCWELNQIKKRTGGNVRIFALTVKMTNWIKFYWNNDRTCLASRNIFTMDTSEYIS